jgi:two-component system response regulator HydG
LNKNIIGFSPEVMAIFQNYKWPGNLRELQNCIKRATLLSQGDFIEKAVLPIEFFLNEEKKTTVFSLSENEKETILETLHRTNNNKTEAAKLLKINRKTLYNKLKLYGIN